MQGDENGGAKRQDAAKRQEEALQATIWQSVKKERRGRNKKGGYFGKFKNWVSFLTLLTVVIYTGLTAELWREEIRANAISKSAYVAGTRPWLKLSSAKPVRLAVDNEWVVILMNLKIRNIGREPAENAFITQRVLRSLATTDYGNAVRQVCGDAAIRRTSDLSQIIFPDEELTSDEYAFPITIGEIKAARNVAVQQGIESKSELSGGLFSTFMVVGCVTYTYSADNSLGQTAFILAVDRPCEQSPVGKCSFDVGRPGFYEAKDMLITEEREGLFAR